MILSKNYPFFTLDLIMPVISAKEGQFFKEGAFLAHSIFYKVLL
jgi:hypothetical protein